MDTYNFGPDNAGFTSSEVMGNEKKQEGEQQFPLPNQNEREAESNVALKTDALGHEEDQRDADTNRFGNGMTTVDSQTKSGWSDPK